jgi:hypothetical protein
MDASFPPIKEKQIFFDDKNCYWISENNSDLPEKGDCFSIDTWKYLSNHKLSLIKGLQDSLAGVKSSEAEEYNKYQIENSQEAKKIKIEYALATHGTRSVSVISKYSDQSSNPIPVRVVTSQAGTVKKDVSKYKVNYKQYGNGCNLRDWDKKEVMDFSSGGIQSYQTRLQNIFNSVATLRVVSISLGYKKSWIAEDNPKCKQEYIDKEFNVLKDSWLNLLRKNKNILFVVAAGNESANFDDEKNKSDDLWAVLYGEPNLLLV